MGTPLTPEQTERAVRLLDDIASISGCAFVNSRLFAGGTCAQENGRGYDCFFCATRAFLKEIGREVKER
jgi:hypothetical protein